jgi:hypothetical protein
MTHSMAEPIAKDDELEERAVVALEKIAEALERLNAVFEYPITISAQSVVEARIR